ncbi:MAG: L-threonylcarbamoyladenylate synthase [Coxiellaceae bacterium]|nr:L-threonylcarbamoyladenylate synthase [Coxiellaceae bacterium]
MQRLYLHPDNPHPRVITQAMIALQAGEVVAFQTVSGYALGCMLDNKAGVDLIRRIRDLPTDHHFTLLCRDLSEISSFAIIDNATFRLLRTETPGPYTFILPATKQVPRRLMHPKRRTIGVRVSPHPIVTALLGAIDAPLMSASLRMDALDSYVVDLDQVAKVLTPYDGVLLDSGGCKVEPTQVIDCTSGTARTLR